MTAAAIATKQLAIPAELEQEIFLRIDRAALHICEAELRYQLRWDERRDGSLLDVLDELERRGFVESSLHFRLVSVAASFSLATMSRRGATAPGSRGRFGDDCQRDSDAIDAARRARRWARARLWRRRRSRPTRRVRASHMTGGDEAKRAIRACQHAGLPVVNLGDCTCALRGRLVVRALPHGLR
ncbi:MAG: hypothetical protein JO372_11495, partial [Solirubrobacterales bacterium]|nr:hypothetical protein [Solirubrobacterales bacterium]